MTTDDDNTPHVPTPYAAAITVREYRDALARRDRLAMLLADQLPPHAAAATFARRTAGIPQCELRRRNSTYVADADFLTAKRGRTNSLRLSCRHHLSDFLDTESAASWTAVLPLSASPSHRRWTCQLQLTHRIMLSLDDSQHRQKLERVAQLLRRLLIPHDHLDFI